MKALIEQSPFPLTTIVEMVGEDKESVHEIITIFCEDVPGYLSSLKSHLQAQEFDSAAKIIHTLKSTVSLAGEDDLVKSCNKYQIADVLAKAEGSTISIEIIEPIEVLLEKAFKSLALLSD